MSTPAHKPDVSALKEHWMRMDVLTRAHPASLRVWVATGFKGASKRPWLGSILAGGLLGLSFPPFDLPILQVPAWILILHLASSAPDRRTAYARLSLAFGIWNLSATYWLMMATVSGGMAAIVANTLLMGLPGLLLREVLRREWPIGAQALGIAGTWTAFEFFHHHWDLSWPWLTLGNAWSVWPDLIQWISLTGHLGISFWVMGSSVVLYGWLLGGTRGGDSRMLGNSASRFSPAWAIWLLPLLSVPFRLLSPDQSGVIDPAVIGAGDVTGTGHATGAEGMTGAEHVTGAKDATDMGYVTEAGSATGMGYVTIALVQPDQNSLLPNGGQPSLSALVDTLIRQTETVLHPDVDVILWPENAVDGILEDGDAMMRRLSIQSQLWSVPLTTGATYLDSYEGRVAPAAVRRQFRSRPYNLYNAALHFDAQPGSEPGRLLPAASTPSIYRKANLVPVVERFPFINVLLRIPGFTSLDWERWLGYGKGTEAPLFTSRDGFRTAPLVCYDSVYPDWVRTFVLEGADVLTVITNDGWWGNTSGHTQHFEFARLRAIEFRRSVVRSANNGISGLIGPDGRVINASRYGESDQFIVHAPVSTQMTLFARWGNWVGWLSVAIAAMSLLLLIRSAPRSR